METQFRKKNKTIRRAAAALMGASALLLAGTAQAALQDRDLDGNGEVDAFYDTDLNVTWLRNANVNGTMDWDTAVAWAAGFSFAGYSDWRLPTSDTCVGWNCTGSEMGHLWYVELGNKAGGSMSNTGNFQNLQAWVYWSGTEEAPNSRFARTFYTSDGIYAGYQTYGVKGGSDIFSMAVRPGDVLAVPEPATYALMLAGLGALVVARRRAR